MNHVSHGGWTAGSGDQIAGRVKGTWRRFALLLWRAGIPIPLIVVLFLVSKYAVDIGLDKTKYSAAIIAGDVSARTVGLLVTAVLIAWALGSVTTFLSGLADQLISRNLRRMVWRKILHLPLSFFSDTPPREVVSRITTDTETMGRYLMTTVYPFLVSIYTTYAVAARLFEYDPRLTWAVIALVPLLVVLNWVVGKFQFLTQRDVALRRSSLTQRIGEGVSAIPVIKSFGVIRREGQRGDSFIHGLYDATVRQLWIQNGSQGLFRGIGLLQTVVVIGTGVYLMNHGQLTTAQWVAFFMYSVQLSGVISTITGLWSSTKSQQGTIARVSEIVDVPGESQTGEPFTPGSADIRLDDVSFTYRTGAGHERSTALRHISHTFRAGTVTAVLGPSGSGKSSLLAIIDRLYSPDAGQITIGGRPADDFALDSYRAGIGFVGQSGPIISGTIRDNLLLGADRPHPDIEMLDALSIGSSTRDMMSTGLPDGLDTQVGDYGSWLSGGQRRRVLLARAVLQNPRFLLLDEPTAGLDTGAAEDVHRAIRAVSAGRTVILVSHDLRALDIVDEGIVLSRGRITAAGDPGHLRACCAFLQDGADEDER